MDNFDRNNIVKAALEVLHCTDLPFLLVIPDCTKLKTYSRTSAIDHAKERSAKYVTCRLNDDGRDKIACTFDDKPVPEPAVPHGYGFICGRCVSNVSYDTEALLYIGGDEQSKSYYVNVVGEAHKYAKDKIRYGDGLELKVKIDSTTNKLTICKLTDILSHTRTIVTTTELKKE